jgi:hypothetical protein
MIVGGHEGIRSDPSLDTLSARLLKASLAVGPAA